MSHEKSIPVADATRSYAGLEGAEQELSAVVKRVMSIIDDSESTSLSLLLHYKWDVIHFTQVPLNVFDSMRKPSLHIPIRVIADEAVRVMRASQGSQRYCTIPLRL